MLSTILIIAAFVLFTLAALGVPSGKINMVSAGLACWTLSLILNNVLMHN